MDCLNVNTVILGGGGAGLWLLDELRREGRSALLLEAGALGDGQTVASQGILHSGLKYTLQGLLTAAAREARDMPPLWRRCLTGIELPDLSDVTIRSQSFHLWRTDSVASRLGMIGARIGLRVTPVEVPRDARPTVFARCPGQVALVDEQVISTPSLIESLARRNRDRILKIDFPRGLDFDLAAAGRVRRLRLYCPGDGLELDIAPENVVLTAGAGNALLRERLWLGPSAMQRRPLHMVLVRGAIPELYGHCVDGARTRVSITSAGDAAGRMVWQVGGQVAEDGVKMDALSLVRHVRAELNAVLPGVDLGGAEWSAYRIDRAEGVAPGGARPDSYRVLCEGNVITAWPTKLVLVPQVAHAIVQTLPAATGQQPELPEELAIWPRPDVALPPWERIREWHQLDEFQRAAA